MMKLIDSHAHIYARKFENDREEVIQRSIEAGLERIFMPNIDHESIEPMLEMELKYPELCIPMMGLHPCSVEKKFEKQLYEVEEWLGRRPFAAVGECGVDLYWDKSLLEEQLEALRIQIQFAKKFNLPLVLHCRNSFEETIKEIEAAQDGSLRGVFHCFTGSLEEALRVEKVGFYIGIGGVSTFKNGGLEPVMKDFDLNKILLETDCPYLAPVPKRGKRNEPSYVTWVADTLSEHKKMDTEQIAEQTSQNCYDLYSFPF